MRQAMYLPIWISRRVYILEAKGRLFIDGKISPGMIQYGYGDIAIFDKRRSRSIWHITGNIIFSGKARIGHGTKISVGKTGTLKIGDNFNVSAESSIICHKSIQIGNNCLMSWDVLIMDTDVHKIKEISGEIINKPSEIIIGNDVWIGCRCLILKGANIPNGNIIAANSTVAKSNHSKENCIVVDGTKILKEQITWEL